MDAPTFSTLNWYAMVVEAWGNQWAQPEVVYCFSNDRTFNDGPGIYSQS